MQTLRQDLTTLLNCHSAESNSNTPDFILAEYLIDCLAAYDRATAARHRHHHGVNETMEMVLLSDKFKPATPHPTTPALDLPPIGATLRFTQRYFCSANEVEGAEVVVTKHDGIEFDTTSTNPEYGGWVFYNHNWREGLEIVAIPQLPATPHPTTPALDLPPIGATLRFTEDGFNCADEQVGNEVTVIEHLPDGAFRTTANKVHSGVDSWLFHESDWRDGLEIVTLPSP